MTEQPPAGNSGPGDSPCGLAPGGSHDHGHGHDHRGHGHHHHPTAKGASRSHQRRLAIVLALAAVYMVAEVVGGLLTNSLALLADAGHMLSDVAALSLSFFAVWLAQRPSPKARTYGYHRAEILAALANSVTLIVIALYIFYEAYQRIWDPPEVQGPLMMGIAVGGLAVNLLGLWILNTGRAENLNIRGAWLHVLTDALGSVGAIGAGVLIWGFGWDWADPVASVLIGALVIYSSWHLLSESLWVLMESVPARIDIHQVRSALRGLPGVIDVHDLHVWTITSGMDAISAHVIAREDRLSTELLREVHSVLCDRFQLTHATIQLEPPGFEGCDLNCGAEEG